MLFIFVSLLFAFFEISWSHFYASSYADHSHHTSNAKDFSPFYNFLTFCPDRHLTLLIYLPWVIGSVLQTLMASSKMDIWKTALMLGLWPRHYPDTIQSYEVCYITKSKHKVTPRPISLCLCSKQNGGSHSYHSEDWDSSWDSCYVKRIIGGIKIQQWSQWQSTRRIIEIQNHLQSSRRKVCRRQWSMILM